MVGLLGCCCCCCLLLLWAFVVTFSDSAGVDVVFGRCCCSWFYQIFCLVVTGVLILILFFMSLVMQWYGSRFPSVYRTKNY